MKKYLGVALVVTLLLMSWSILMNRKAEARTGAMLALILYGQSPIHDFMPMIPMPKAVDALVSLALDSLYGEKNALEADIKWATALPVGRYIYVKDVTAADGRNRIPKIDWIDLANAKLAALNVHIAALEEHVQ